MKLMSELGIHFPFGGKPMLVSLMYKGDEEAFIEAMKERKKLIPAMIEASATTGQKACKNTTNILSEKESAQGSR